MASHKFATACLITAAALVIIGGLALSNVGHLAQMAHEWKCLITLTAVAILMIALVKNLCRSKTASTPVAPPPSLQFPPVSPPVAPPPLALPPPIVAQRLPSESVIPIFTDHTAQSRVALVASLDVAIPYIPGPIRGIVVAYCIYNPFAFLAHGQVWRECPTDRNPYARVEGSMTTSTYPTPQAWYSILEPNAIFAGSAVIQPHDSCGLLRSQYVSRRRMETLDGILFAHVGFVDCAPKDKEKVTAICSQYLSERYYYSLKSAVCDPLGRYFFFVSNNLHETIQEMVICDLQTQRVIHTLDLLPFASRDIAIAASDKAVAICSRMLETSIHRVEIREMGTFTLLSTIEHMIQPSLPNYFPRIVLGNNCFFLEFSEIYHYLFRDSS